MKNTLLIVASLALGTAAIAQDMPAGGTPATPPSTPDMTAPSGAPSDTTMPPASGSMNNGAMPGGSTPDSSMPNGSMSNGSMSSGSMSNGSMSNGSMSGGMSSGNMAQAQQMASSTDTSNYPKCGKGVTDKCVQAGGMGMHKKTMRKPR